MKPTMKTKILTPKQWEKMPSLICARYQSAYNPKGITHIKKWSHSGGLPCLLSESLLTIRRLAVSVGGFSRVRKRSKAVPLSHK
jgi:hypothetical protein